jgi:hypothetical protein
MGTGIPFPLGLWGGGGSEWPKHDADYSSVSSVEDKYAWSCTYALSLGWFLIKERCNFTYT